LTHVDFIEVIDGKAVTIVVPIVLTGNSRGVRSGGRLKSALRNLKVKGLIDALPSAIEHDITELRIGQSIRVSDIKVGKLYEILNSDNAVVVSIATSRTSVAETGDDDTAVEEAPAAEASAE
jgi:large subunit ribosomal protein L25